MPAHALSPAERVQVRQVANEPRFADVPPARIVPMLAGEGVHLASESNFSRVLREHGQTVHRGQAKAPGGAPADHAFRGGPAAGPVLGHDPFTGRSLGAAGSTSN